MNTPKEFILPSRDGTDNRLVRLSPYIYKLQTPYNYRVIFNDDKSIYALDPSGGPFLKESYELNEEYNVNQIRNEFITITNNNLDEVEPINLFGVEHREGWDKLLIPIFEYIEKYNSEHEDVIDILQIKEKFGGLRFYTNKYTPDLRNLISTAEELSFKTCEICGKPGETSGTGWISTLCKECLNNK